MEQFISYFGEALLGLIGAAVVYLKVRSERKETKEDRDKDSSEIHDKLIKHDFEISRLKDDMNLNNTSLNDLRDEFAILNNHMIKIEVNLENLAKQFETFLQNYNKKD